MGDQKDSGGNGNPMLRIVLMALVAGYIIYLGVNILRSFFQGEEGLPGWTAVLFGVLFIVAGIAYLFYLYKQYKALKAKEEEEASTSNQTVPDPAETEEPAAEPIEDKESLSTQNSNILSSGEEKNEEHTQD